MGKIKTIFAFKIKQYFGSIRSSKSGLVLGLLAFIGINSLGLSFAMLVDMPFWMELDSFINFFSAFFAIYLALTLVMSLRGGVTAFQAELDFIFTSAIKPRQYIFSDLLFQFVVLHILFSPFIFFIIGLTLTSVMTSMAALISVLVYELYVVLTLLVMQTLGILNLIAPCKKTKILIGSIIAALLLPSLSFVNIFPIEYSNLPYPSTFAAKAIAHLLGQGLLEISSIFFLGAFVAITFMLYYSISKKNLFYYIQPTIMLSFGEIRPQAQAIKQRSAIEKFGPLTTFLTLNPLKGSLMSFLTKKHLVRMIRDGSLISITMLFVIYAAISLVSPSFFSPDTSATTTTPPLFLLTFYSALVPSILATTWNSSDRENLWIPLTSGKHIIEYFKSFFLALLIIALIFPLGLILVSLPFIGLSSLWLILSTLAIASFTSAYTVLTVISIKMPREGSMSLGYFLLLFLPIIGGYISSVPFLTMMFFAPSYNLQFQFLFATILIGYLVSALFGLFKLIEKKVTSIQI
ncbi:MAG: hypothetical protein H3Z50_04855 [archaeon]|nr:hypothetical protein [archaeon]MCP8306657.1 hypothetical protein [archaeon]